MTGGPQGASRAAGAALGLALWAAGASAATAGVACDPAAVTILAPGGAQHFSIEIAADEKAQARGLMFRPSLPAGAGMLFVFDPPRRTSFWMHNTMIPLDMIFIDDTGLVESVAERRDTYSDRTSSSTGKVRAVLEINEGLAQEYGIGPGTRVIHEAFRAAPPEVRCGG